MKGEGERSRGFYGIGLVAPRHPANLGVLWRTAHAMGANFIFTVGARYRRQASDTSVAWKKLPLWQFDGMDDLLAALPLGVSTVAVETSGTTALPGFQHPPRAVYLLGAEDTGLSEGVIASCDYSITIPCPVMASLNVATAGAMVLYDRFTKEYR